MRCSVAEKNGLSEKIVVDVVAANCFNTFPPMLTTENKLLPLSSEKQAIDYIRASL